MGVLTWQNVPGADLGSALGGIRSSADLFDRAAQSAQGAVAAQQQMDAEAKAKQQANVDRYLTQQMHSADEPFAYQKLLDNGLAQGKMADGSMIPKELISPKMLAEIDDRKQLLTKIKEETYQRQMEHTDDRFASDVAEAAPYANNPDPQYAQGFALLNPANTGSAKGTERLLKMLGDLHHPEVRGASGPNSKAVEQAAEIRGLHKAAEIHSLGLYDQDGGKQALDFIKSDPLAGKYLMPAMQSYQPGWRERVLGAGGTPVPGALSDGSGYLPGYVPGGAGGAPGSKGGGSSGGFAGPGQQVMQAPSLSPQVPGGGGKFFSAGPGHRYGKMFEAVQQDFGPNAEMPPGFDWQGNPRGEEPPTFGAIVDWNQRYAIPASIKRGWGVRDGKVVGTTATGLYQITDENRKQFGPEMAKELGVNKWEDIKQTPENERLLAEKVFDKQGWKAWEGLKTLKTPDGNIPIDPKIYEGKSFNELDPMIRALDGGEKPDGHTEEIGVLKDELNKAKLQQNSTPGGRAIVMAQKLEQLQQNQLSRPGSSGGKGKSGGANNISFGPGADVAKGLKNMGAEKINGSEIGKFINVKMQDWKKEFGVDLSPAEEAGLLLSAVTLDSGSFDLSVSDLTPDTTVDEGMLKASIKDFGLARKQSADIQKMENNVKDADHLSGEFKQAKDELAGAIRFAGISPAAQKQFPKRFAAVADASDELGKMFTPKTSLKVNDVKQAVDPKKAAPLVSEAEKSAAIARAIQQPRQVSPLAPKTDEEITKEQTRDSEITNLESQVESAQKQFDAIDRPTRTDREALSIIQTKLDNARANRTMGNIGNLFSRLVRPVEDSDVTQARKAAETKAQEAEQKAAMDRLLKPVS